MAGLMILMSGAVWPLGSNRRVPGGSARVQTVATEDDLLEEMQRRALRYFVEQTDRRSGLTRDRARTDGPASTAPARVAATGFALTAWCIADQRGWLPPGEARRRLRETLKFVAAHVAHERGWLYHLADAKSGQGAGDCEASTIDTAIFLEGAIFAREYLADERVRMLVGELYGRVDRGWALNGGPRSRTGGCRKPGFCPTAGMPMRR
ncbi:MAG: hypothetical protein H7343_23200 [Undibacterium sp.]|nr:hypothetical protein [Opitutaceae bacterium]